MPKFLNLSTVSINVNAIRFLRTGMVKQSDGEHLCCTVWFIGSPEPHAFYDEDAEALRALTQGASVSSHLASACDSTV